MLKPESEPQAPDVHASIERCRAEIAAIEELLLAGHPDVQGLCLALADWSAELRLLERDSRSLDSKSGVGSTRPVS